MIHNKFRQRNVKIAPGEGTYSWNTMYISTAGQLTLHFYHRARGQVTSYRDSPNSAVKEASPPKINGFIVLIFSFS